VSARRVYAGVAENSIYIHSDHHSRGVAIWLLDVLVGRTERAGDSTIQTASPPRTLPASPSTNAAITASSDAVDASTTFTARGATPSSSSAATTAIDEHETDG
jgi:L-amino acid N-acyltransferase YncA